jgi:aldehyde dehydrogenase (NAD+)
MPETPVTGVSRHPLQHPDQFFIGGKWATPSSPDVIDVIQPATEDLYLQVAGAGPADMDRAIAAARDAFDSGPWPRLAPRDRAAYLLGIGAEIRRRSGELSRLWTSEMGVVHAMAAAMVPNFGLAWEEYAALADEFEFVERRHPVAGEAGLLVHEPAGVVGAIVPWNNPLAIRAHKVAPALLAGCTVVLKMAPEAPGEGYVMAEIAEAVGLPEGVLNVVTADREVSEQLVTDPRVDKIAFTGSTATGRRIASLCGERIARYTLELGGKSPLLILDDFDLATAAEAVSGTIRRMTGQVCSTLSRVIVSRDRHDELVALLAGSLSRITVGDPFDQATEMGPLAMRRQLDRVRDYVASGTGQGATLVTGGGRPAGLERGYFIEPTLFAGVSSEMRIAREEIFGPVLTVLPADGEDDAVRIANDTIYGLNASVFTDDAERAYQVARRLRSGTVGHNAQRADYGIGFGGFKQSGVGREGGREGLLSYLESKTVILNATPSGLAVR